MHHDGVHLVFGRLAKLNGDVDVAALERDLRRAAPRLYGRDRGKRTVVLPLPGKAEVLIGVRFAAGLCDSLPFASTDLAEDRRRTRAIDLPALVAGRPEVTLTAEQGFWAALSGTARVGHLYVVAGLPVHATLPLGFEELRRGERLWIGRRTTTLTRDLPLVKVDLDKRDASATVLMTLHPEAAVRDLVSLHTLDELAARAAAVEGAAAERRRQAAHSAEGSAVA
ncbi:MAG: hypothetical protein HYS27_04375 [Deltaproteobacteria bacterium]|nr:hypothetical protein [Deltaproteobacteria bacterium]